MRIPNAEHESGPWRIREVVPDFELEDAWALPAYGTADDFRAMLGEVLSSDPADTQSIPARLLWSLRDLLGKWFGLGRISTADDGTDAGFTIPGTDEVSLAGRLAEDLRGTVDGMHFGHLPFIPLYVTDTEFAAEISNKTVHGVMHLAWADAGDGRYQGRMGVYVKPRGALGHGYMALIKPFRLLIVYPALMKRIERQWSDRPRTPAPG